MTIVSTPEVGLAIQAQVDRAVYLAQLLNLPQRRDRPSWLKDLQNSAAKVAQSQMIPSTRDEDWRFTDLSPLLQQPFEAVASAAKVDIGAFALPEVATRLVFVDGIYAAELSSIANLPAGIGVESLTQTTGPQAPDWVPYLAQQPGAEEVFTALNTASFVDGAIVHVPKNQTMETPIHLLNISTTGKAATISHPRCLVVVGANSSLILVEEYVAAEEGVYFTNPVTEIWLDANAQVNHTRVQRDSKTAFHIGKTAVSQARDSRYTCNAISLGGRISRHHLEVNQSGEQTATWLNGLTLIDGEQVADTHSAIAFTQPHGSSNQVHKCIIGDRAQAVFNGKVFVPKLAQLTDARQLSRNLLLSPKARVDTKPQLEITADNVKCAHGATVSQLDNDEVFYLQSRGIDETSARRLLVYAFAYEVIEQIPVASLKDQLAAIACSYQ